MSTRALQTRPGRYFAAHYNIFRFLGLGWWHHPDEDNTSNFPGLYIYYTIITELVWVVGFVSLESIDPFIGEKNMNLFMFSLAFVITHDLTCIKIYIVLFKNLDIQDIVHTLEIKLYRFYQNEKTIRDTIRITRIWTGVFIFFGWVTIGNADVYGAIMDYRWKTEVALLNDSMLKSPRTLPLPIYIPWNYETDLSYILACVFETAGLMWTGHILLAIDTFVGSLIMHMCSQFKILQEAIKTFYDRTIEELCEAKRLEIKEEGIDIGQDVYKIRERKEELVRITCTEQELEVALENNFKSCIRQHTLLMSCVEKFASTYSYGFMTQLITSLGAIAGVMVQVSQDASSFKSMRLVTSFAFFMAMVTQLAIQCFTGNELTLQASMVSDAVMESNWERMSPRLRRPMALMMLRAQRPLRLNAGGFAYIDINCFLRILKAAYSYYVVLSQTQI